jgi:hypothetical protein
MMNKRGEIIWSRLAPATDKFGVSCDENGPRIGPIHLLKRTERDFEPRWVGELDFVLSAAMNRPVHFASKMGALKAAADALEKGDLARAMLVTQFMWLPSLPDEGALQRAVEADSLTKAGFNPDQSRDGHGRWSNSDASGGETSASEPTNTSHLPVGFTPATDVICTNCHAVVPIPPPVWQGPFDDLIFGPQYSRPNDGVSEEAHRAYEECHAMCLEQYLDGTLPGEGSDRSSRFRQCMRSCMEPQGHNY